MILCSLLNVDIIPGVRPDRKKIVALLLFGLVVPAGLRIIGTTYSRSGTSTSPNGKGSYGTVPAGTYTVPIILVISYISIISVFNSIGNVYNRKLTKKTSNHVSDIFFFGVLD